MKFSEEIFVNNSRESKKFIFLNNEFRLKSDIELQMFTSNTPVSMTETPSEEIIDSLDIDNLRLILKAKCKTMQNLDNNTKSLTKNYTNLLNEEKEKNDEMKTIIRLQKKEIEQNNRYINELQKEIMILKEKSDTKVNKQEEADLEKNDIKDFKMRKNLFSGDSPVSFSSKIEKFDNNVVSKKWPSIENKIVFSFQDFEIKFKKIDVLAKSKVNLMQNQEFRFIDVEICNTSDSALTIDDFHFDSTASKLKNLKNIAIFYLIN